MYANWTTERAEQEIIRLCHSGLDSHSLRLAVFGHLKRVMPYEAFWCSTTDPSTMLFTSAVIGGFEAEETLPYISNEFLDDDFNKMADLARARRPVSTLQIATRGDLTRSQRYREILEPAGLGHEMRAVFRTGGAVWGAMCLHRQKGREDFTPEHLAFLAAIAPHLAAGIRSAVLLDAIEVTPATDGPGLLLLAEDFSIISTTPGAEYLLAESSDWSPGKALPLPVVTVVSKLRALERESPPATNTIPRVRLRSRAGRWLALHASRLSHAEGHVAVIIEVATPNDVAPFVLQAYALTAREQEIALRILKGHATDDISTELCISTFTVQQHLKAVFDKVGVRSRRELVAHIFARSYWPALARDQGMAPDRWSPA